MIITTRTWRAGHGNLVLDRAQACAVRTSEARAGCATTRRGNVGGLATLTSRTMLLVKDLDYAELNPRPGRGLGTGREGLIRHRERDDVLTGARAVAARDRVEGRAAELMPPQRWPGPTGGPSAGGCRGGGSPRRPAAWPGIKVRPPTGDPRWRTRRAPCLRRRHAGHGGGTGRGAWVWLPASRRRWHQCSRRAGLAGRRQGRAGHGGTGGGCEWTWNLLPGAQTGCRALVLCVRGVTFAS